MTDAGEGTRIRVRIAQTAPRRADVEHNRQAMQAIAREAASEGVDLLVFPEMALTGYDLGDRVREVAVDLRDGPGLPWPPEGPLTLYGLVERSEEGLFYNSAVAARHDRILHVHRKLHLPTYGSFDEGRLFAPGRTGPSVFRAFREWRIALLVCEDVWHPVNPYLAALREADLLVVLSAAPGRGEPEPDGKTSEGRERRFASRESWELIARTTALAHGMWVILANRVGVEGPLTFGGGSFVVTPDGSVAARAGEHEATLLDHVLDRGAVRRARSPFSHLRDHDPARAARELQRILEERR